MKTKVYTTPNTTQQQLEEKAVDAMIAYERRFISRQEMNEAIDRAIRHYADIEGHRQIVLKGWIIKTIYTLDSRQLDELERITTEYLNDNGINTQKRKNYDEIQR